MADADSNFLFGRMKTTYLDTIKEKNLLRFFS